MKKTWLAWTAAALALPGAAQAQSENFVTTMGGDTVAIETFVRTATRLDGDLSGRALQMRLRYSLDLSNNAPTAMRLEVLPAGADTAAMRGKFTFQRDSVIAEMTRGGAAQPVQRLVTRPNATPFINLSFSLVELAIARQPRVAGQSAEVPLFMIANGSTVVGQLTWPHADSAVIDLGGVDLRMHLDARGRILHAHVPSQKVTVTRVAGTLNRAADAKPDYRAPAGAAFTAEDVFVKTSEGHTLAGTLTLPKARQGRVPAVITISGSGPQDRDETLAGIRGYQPFREIATSLAGRGVATLRYDDRGFGASGGVHATATSLDFARDTRAIIAYLRTRPEIDPARIFLVGHSEGGLIAPLVASTDTALRGIVLLAGPAYTGRRILEYQSRYGAEQMPQLTAAQRDSMLRGGMAKLDSVDVSQPWLRFFRDYDPVPTLQKVKIPVLVLQGATDRQVTADQAAVIANTLRAAGNSNVAVHVLPNVNHLFLQDPVGSGAGYSALPSKSLVPEVLDLIGDWITTHAK